MLNDVSTNMIALSLHSNLDDIENDWLALQGNGLCTFYQTFEWTKAWQDTAGKTRNIVPSIICGRLPDEDLAFILPFVVERHLGNRVLRWHSADELTYGMGIFNRQWLAETPDVSGTMQQLWPEILKTLGKIDTIQLEKQPQSWDGIDNPLRFLFTTRGANQSYKMALQDNYQALYEHKRSGSSRRSARKRDKKLLAAGDVVFGLPQTSDETARVINTMVNQQRSRLGERGIHSVYSDERLAFLQQLAQTTASDGTPMLLPYRLIVDDKICAVMLGGSFQSTYWALISSLTTDTTLHALSPGDHALRAMIEAVCNKGDRLLDFSAGDTPYKSHWCDETVALFETIKVVTLKGAVLATTAMIGSTLKRLIKQTPWLFSFAQSARKALFKKKN